MNVETIARCATCDMPVKVVFEGGELVAAYAVCDHIDAPQDRPRAPAPPAA